MKRGNKPYSVTFESLVMRLVKQGFVEPLSKLAPHGTEHHFGQGSQPWILLDFVVLQADALLLVV